MYKDIYIEWEEGWCVEVKVKVKSESESEGGIIGDHHRIIIMPSCEPSGSTGL